MLVSVTDRTELLIFHFMFLRSIIHYLAAIVFDFTAGRREEKAFLLPIYVAQKFYWHKTRRAKFH